jgi:ATP-dependent exoDNAse (exonuclease V) beta subunit
LSPGKDLGRTPVQAQYNREAEKLFIESLNTLYVALTRPIDRLYLLAKKEEFERKSDTSRVNVSYLLYQYLVHKNIWETEKNTYTLHEGLPKKEKYSPVSDDEVVLLDKIICADWQDRAKLSRKASVVFDLESFDQHKDIHNKLSYALSNLPCAEALDEVLMEMEMQGLLDSGEIVPMQEALQQILSNKDIELCFNKKARLIIASDIICKKALSLQSPDRVIMLGQKVCILKFVSCPPSDSDKKALNRYAKFLAEMGYTLVEKLIVCTEDRTVVKW